MLQQQAKMMKPTKMFVYLPLYLAEKKPGRPPADGVEPVFKVCVVKDMPYTRIEVGDDFITRKRDKVEEILSSEDNLKVVQVKRSIVDSSCIVILEGMTFDKEDKLKEFLKNKRCIR